MMLGHVPLDCDGTLSHPANTKHLYNICTTSAQRLRRWSNIIQMLYKCFVFTGHVDIVIHNKIQLSFLPEFMTSTFTFLAKDDVILLACYKTKSSRDVGNVDCLTAPCPLLESVNYASGSLYFFSSFPCPLGSPPETKAQRPNV